MKEFPNWPKFDCPVCSRATSCPTQEDLDDPHFACGFCGYSPSKGEALLGDYLSNQLDLPFQGITGSYNPTSNTSSIVIASTKLPVYTMGSSQPIDYTYGHQYIVSGDCQQGIEL